VTLNTEAICQAKDSITGAPEQQIRAPRAHSDSPNKAPNSHEDNKATWNVEPIA
jgi:hypothetical protein